MSQKRKHQLLLALGIVVPLLAILSQSEGLSVIPVGAGWTVAQIAALLLAVAGNLRVAVGNPDALEQAKISATLHRIMLLAGILTPVVSALANSTSPGTAIAAVGGTMAAIVGDIGKARGRT